MLAWVTGFEPTNMNPSSLTTLDSMVLGEIDEFSDDIVKCYNEFRIKEALILTKKFAGIMRLELKFLNSHGPIGLFEST